MNYKQKLAKILDVSEKVIADFECSISAATGKKGVLENLAAENERIIAETLRKINSGPDGTAEHVRSSLQKAIFYDEKKFLDFLEKVPGKNDFEKATVLSRRLAKIGRGFFLKKDLIREIFKKRKPKNLLNYLKLGSVDELLAENDLTEAFSALRFVESDEWMHQTFEEVYGGFSEADFEERDIEIKVLSPRWHDIAGKFIEKKYHNLSHLKEFGVIFLNPVKMDIPGKFLRDFALMLHYFHEIDFYSKLFRKYSSEPNFPNRFRALLRGDVKELMEIKKKNSWLIVQRYLIKDNPHDPRLYLPRINPESLHWLRGERDLASVKGVDLSMWLNLDWVGGIFQDGADEIVSFDLEDNAMSFVSAMEGDKKNFSYHQREAMWTRIFTEYLGGEEKLEQMIIDNFDKGYISL